MVPYASDGGRCARRDPRGDPRIACAGSGSFDRLRGTDPHCRVFAAQEKRVLFAADCRVRGARSHRAFADGTAGRTGRVVFVEPARQPPCQRGRAVSRRGRGGAGDPARRSHGDDCSGICAVRAKRTLASVRGLGPARHDPCRHDRPVHPHGKEAAVVRRAVARPAVSLRGHGIYGVRSSRGIYADRAEAV